MTCYLGSVVERARESLDMKKHVRAAVVGLHLTVYPADPKVPGSQVRFVDEQRRELGMSPEYIRLVSREKLHAILAAFAVGATEIKWMDGSTLVLDEAQHTIRIGAETAG